VQEQSAHRRLVKSSPELWAQCSDPVSLARHLSGFGDIRITRLEPESAVAWEGESASGTVTLEASGWGTRVRLTAQPPQTGVAPTPEPVADAAAETGPRPLQIVSQPVLAPRGLSALVGSLLKRRREAPGATATTTPAEPPVSETSAGIAVPSSAGVTPSTDAPPHAAAPNTATAPNTAAAPSPESPSLLAELEAALDSLGQAHHRPYSRS
jgi:hypothetical protein